MARRSPALILLALCAFSLSACIVVPAGPAPRAGLWVPAHYNGWRWVPGHWA